MKRLVRGVVRTAIVAAVIFGLAGTWRDPWLWAYLAVLGGGLAWGLLSIDEGLRRERFTPPSQGADRAWLRVIRLTGLAHFVVGIVDGTRFHWTPIAPPLRLIGLAGLAIALALMVRAMSSNRYFSAVIRVQTDRGHTVVDRGPYAVIRHPGYAGMMLGIPFSALALGSWISFALALAYAALIFRRVLFEDRFLHANLAGYADYASRVRYRLVPGAF